MSEAEVRDFQIQMEIDSELADELSLHLDVKQALAEKDIINLRENLNQIVQNQSEKESIGIFNSFSFGLSEEISSFKNLDYKPNADLSSLSNSFPKIHLYQHQIAGKENIHQFYKEQFNADALNEEGSFTPFEEELFSDIQNALQENEILDIRANLKQIAQSMPAHQYSTEDIDNYLNNQLDEDSRVQFDAELSINQNLAHDVQIIRDIDLACTETDIINLRASLREIQKTEFQTSSGIEKIEGYLYHELSEEEMASFEAELSANSDLLNEIGLVKDIDNALQESDVMQLRNSLQNIATQIADQKQTEQSFLTRIKARRILVSSVAASLILLLGLTGLLTRLDSQEKVYQKYYAAYQTPGNNRSASNITDLNLTLGLQKYNNKEFDLALNLLKEVTLKDRNNSVAHFYTAAALQEKARYSEAISEYQQVSFLSEEETRVKEHLLRKISLQGFERPGIRSTTAAAMAVPSAQACSDRACSLAKFRARQRLFHFR
jgi:hypothetical protein